MVFVLLGILIPLSSFPNRIWLFKVTIAMPYFAIENHSFNIGLRLNWEKIRSSCPMKYVIKMKLTNACESISRVSRKTRAVEWSFGVCTVRISMTVVCIDGTFVDIWKVLFHIFFSKLIAFNRRSCYLIQADSCLFTQCLGSWMPVTGTWEPFVATRVAI